MPFDESYEIKTEKWKGFLEKWRKEEGCIYSYSFWYKGKGKPLELVFMDKNGILKKEEIENMISSLRLVSSEKTAKDYFQEGLNLFNQSKYEEAKFKFVNALCIDGENAECYYYLARAFLKTGKQKEAERHLKETITFQPDYLDAQKLLQEIRKSSN